MRRDKLITNRIASGLIIFALLFVATASPATATLAKSVNGLLDADALQDKDGGLPDTDPINDVVRDLWDAHHTGDPFGIIVWVLCKVACEDKPLRKVM